jgi:hypothetical protein
MIQCRGSACFTFESFQRLWIACQFFGEKFQRDVPMQLEIFGFINHTHAAATELF